MIDYQEVKINLFMLPNQENQSKFEFFMNFNQIYNYKEKYNSIFFFKFD